eukprot:scaffold91221_cov15-Tisochrysis_lutea.AAC.1
MEIPHGAIPSEDDACKSCRAYISMPSHACHGMEGWACMLVLGQGEVTLIKLRARLLRKD